MWFGARAVTIQAAFEGNSANGAWKKIRKNFPSFGFHEKFFPSSRGNGVNEKAVSTEDAADTARVAQRFWRAEPLIHRRSGPPSRRAVRPHPDSPNKHRCWDSTGQSGCRDRLFRDHDSSLNLSFCKASQSVNAEIHSCSLSSFTSFLPHSVSRRYNPQSPELIQQPDGGFQVRSRMRNADGGSVGQPVQLVAAALT